MPLKLERIAHEIRQAGNDLRLDLARMDMVDAERAVVRAREEYDAATAAFHLAVLIRNTAPEDAKHAAQAEFWRRREFMRLAEFQLDRRRGLAMDAQRAYRDLGGDLIDNPNHDKPAFANVDMRAELGGVISD